MKLIWGSVAIPFKSGHRFLRKSFPAIYKGKLIVAIPFKSGHRFLQNISRGAFLCAQKVAIPFKSGHRFLQIYWFLHNQYSRLSQSPSNRVTDSYGEEYQVILDGHQSQSPSNRVTDSYARFSGSAARRGSRVAIPFKSGHRFLRGSR